MISLVFEIPAIVRRYLWHPSFGPVALKRNESLISAIYFSFLLQAKYEAVSQEKNELLQVTKELQMKIKALEEKQAEILQRTSVNAHLTQLWLIGC